MKLPAATRREFLQGLVLALAGCTVKPATNQPDFGTPPPPDLMTGTPPPDLARRLDAAVPTDMALSSDAARADMAVPRDMAAPKDIAQPPDLKQPPDLVPPTYRVEAGYAFLPCQFPAQLRLLQKLIFGLATEGGGQAGDKSDLFEVDPAALAPIPYATRISFMNNARTPSYFEPTVGSRGVVTANEFGGQYGFYEIDRANPGAFSFISLPQGYTTAGGALFAGGTLFVAAANRTVMGAFDPGAILCYAVDMAGNTVGPPKILKTSSLNPTGLALRGGQILCLNSGDFSQNSKAVLDVVDVNNQVLLPNSKIDLTSKMGTPVTAQLSGHIAVSNNQDMAVIGTADGSGRVFFLDLAAQKIAEEVVIAGSKFHSSIRITGNTVFVTDFNSGTVHVLELASRRLLQSLKVAMGQVGPSEIYNGTLVQAVPYGAVRLYAA